VNIKFPAIAVLTVALVGSSLIGASAANATTKPNPKRTYIVNCQGTLDFKPKEIVIACADAGVRFDSITWSRWTNNGATGRGNLVVNTCEPTCADGNFITYRRVRLTLGMQASGPGFGTFVNVFSELKGDFGNNLGPALARTSTWKLDNAIRDK
jgi:hypothetical protein